jgi:hypothetical protein
LSARSTLTNLTRYLPAEIADQLAESGLESDMLLNCGVSEYVLTGVGRDFLSVYGTCTLASNAYER